MPTSCLTEADLTNSEHHHHYSLPRMTLSLMHLWIKTLDSAFRSTLVCVLHPLLGRNFAKLPPVSTTNDRSLGLSQGSEGLHRPASKGTSYAAADAVAAVATLWIWRRLSLRFRRFTGSFEDRSRRTSMR